MSPPLKIFNLGFHYHRDKKESIKKGLIKKGLKSPLTPPVVGSFRLYQRGGKSPLEKGGCRGI
jgi:hypothetical protein